MSVALLNASKSNAFAGAACLEEACVVFATDAVLTEPSAAQQRMAAIACGAKVRALKASLEAMAEFLRVCASLLAALHAPCRKPPALDVSLQRPNNLHRFINALHGVDGETFDLAAALFRRVRFRHDRD